MAQIALEKGVSSSLRDRPLARRLFRVATTEAANRADIWKALLFESFLLLSDFFCRSAAPNAKTNIGRPVAFASPLLHTTVAPADGTDSHIMHTLSRPNKRVLSLF